MGFQDGGFGVSGFRYAFVVYLLFHVHIIVMQIIYIYIYLYIGMLCSVILTLVCMWGFDKPKTAPQTSGGRRAQPATPQADKDLGLGFRV